MVKIDIFNSRRGSYDIIVIDTEQYLTGTLFDYIVEFLRRHVSEEIRENWFMDCREENIAACLGYKGIAIRLFDVVRDRTAAKAELKRLVEAALEAIH